MKLELAYSLLKTHRRLLDPARDQDQRIRTESSLRYPFPRDWATIQAYEAGDCGGGTDGVWLACCVDRAHVLKARLVTVGWTIRHTKAPETRSADPGPPLFVYDSF